MFLLTATAMLLGSTGPVVVRGKDPITDQSVIAAGWESEGDLIAVACYPASAAIQVKYSSDKHYFGRTGLFTASWPLTYRFDDAEPVSQPWSHDNHAAELLTSGRIASFIDQLAGSKRLVIRARDDFGRGEQFDTIFDLGDVRPALTEVLRECRTSKVVGKLSVKFDL